MCWLAKDWAKSLSKVYNALTISLTYQFLLHLLIRKNLFCSLPGNNIQKKKNYVKFPHSEKSVQTHQTSQAVIKGPQNLKSFWKITFENAKENIHFTIKQKVCQSLSKSDKGGEGGIFTIWWPPKICFCNHSSRWIDLLSEWNKRLCRPVWQLWAHFAHLVARVISFQLLHGAYSKVDLG